MPARQTNFTDDALRQQQQLYDQTWQKGLQAGKEQRGNLQTNLQFLEQTGIVKPSDKILEIGCGIGSIVTELAKQGHDVIGTDISREAIRYGLKKYGDIKLKVQPAEKLDFDDATFDVVLSFDLFEHIAQIDRHISEVWRVLKPQGYYLFQTPNKLSNVIFETLSKKSLKWRIAHPSLHSPRQLRRRMSRHGFDVRFVKMNPINEFTLEKLKKLGPLRSVIARIDFCRMPLTLQTNLYIVAKKTSPARPANTKTSACL